MSLFPNSGSRTYRLVRLFMGRKIRQLEQNTQDPKSAQKAVLNAICSNMSKTTFGRSHHLSTVRDFQSFRQQVPIRTYHEFDEWMSLVIQGQSKVLTMEPVTSFVETSGTQAEPKLIPVTSSWSRHIRDAQMLWVLGLLEIFQYTNGAITHHVSTTTERYTDGGVPIGANTGRMVDALPLIFQRRFVLSGLPEVPDIEQRMYVHLARFREAGHSMVNTILNNCIVCSKVPRMEAPLRQDLTQGTLMMGLHQNYHPIYALRSSPYYRTTSHWTGLSNIWPLGIGMLDRWSGSILYSILTTLLGADVPIRDVGITASEGYLLCH